MAFYQCEELRRGHLKRNGDILIGIHQNHIIFCAAGVQKSSAVIFDNRNICRKIKIFFSQVCDRCIDLHSLNGARRKVCPALPGIGAGAVTKHQDRRGIALSTHKRGSESIVIVHAGKTSVLHLDRLYAKKHICGENYLTLILPNLQIIVNRLAFIGQILLPESKGITPAERQAQKKHENTGNRLTAEPLFTDEENERYDKQNGGKDQKGNTCSYCGDGDEGGEKGPQNTPDCVAGTQPSDDDAAFIQTAYRGFDKCGCNRTQKKKRKDEQKNAGSKCCDNQIACAQGKDQKGRDTQHNILPNHGDGSYPERGYQDSSVEPSGIGVFVSGLPAVKISCRHGNHDRADDDGPDNLGGRKVRSEKPAGSQLHSHHGHAGEKLREIQKPLVL